MKLFILFSALVGITAVVAFPAQPNEQNPSADQIREGNRRPDRGRGRQPFRPSRPSVGCVSRTRAVPLYRAFNQQKMDHFYSTNLNEIESLERTQGYHSQGIAGYIFPSLQTDTVALFRLYNPSTIDHIWTISDTERRDRMKAGWRDEGTAGFVYASGICSSEAFFRLVNSASNDHFFTRSVTERNDAEHQGYKSEGTAGFILSSNK